MTDSGNPIMQGIRVHQVARKLCPKKADRKACRQELRLMERYLQAGYGKDKDVSFNAVLVSPDEDFPGQYQMNILKNNKIVEVLNTGKSPNDGGFVAKHYDNEGHLLLERDIGY